MSLNFTKSAISLLAILLVAEAVHARESQLPKRTTYTASKEVVCINQKVQVSLDKDKKITSGKLELTDVDGTYLIYKLNISAELKGVICAFELMGLAPKVKSEAQTRTHSIFHGFVNNKNWEEKRSACADALNLNESNITFILSKENPSVLVKGIDIGQPSNECGNLIFTQDRATNLDL